ncbi:prepilin-type N-terminal cleavage/methylation domain-containing protein [Candidatus Saccharibacteria bacterium]|nr:prepilin-type N-terminal cleavage/methylation domain-containing protein [Candidatus Saccharibacteria bacterium]MCB9817407.1 prepilin-type N-terminal cleavage/methylation domain-containing protein [Candidatus Nomurabacteria bacterium]HPD99319.1 prepilin-type N-terminal cleavage/methylation domain-containing protein [Candidatus Saccharibacteria bacterium]
MPCSKKGFTIVELMIAMLVFGVASLLVTAAVIGMSRQYQKGSYTAQLNDASRSIHQDIFNAVAYVNKDAVTNMKTEDSVTYFCIGNVMYYWSLPDGNTINNGLFKRQLSDAACERGQANGGTNLLPRNGFVSQFTITQPSADLGVFDITTRFNVGTYDMYKNNSYTECLPTLRGGDFCTIVNYNSSVKPRIQ